MRNAITFLAAVLAVMLVGVMPSKAQDTGDMIYVYQKNGGILPFVRSEISEFFYSFEDEDSVTHDEPVMQCIVMEDSIIRIPINNIDSVSFVTPSTVYQPGVIRIEQGLMDYVESCDDETSTIRLSAGTPSAIVPKVGDKLVTLEMNEKFEGGFAGVVSKVSTDADGITIQCDLAGYAINGIVHRIHGVAFRGNADFVDVFFLAADGHCSKHFYCFVTLWREVLVGVVTWR